MQEFGVQGQKIIQDFPRAELYTDAPYFGRNTRPAEQRHPGRDDQFIEW